MKKILLQDNLEKSRLRQIRELDEALKDLNKGTPVCRAIARQSLEILKRKRLMDLGRNL